MPGISETAIPEYPIHSVGHTRMFTSVEALSSITHVTAEYQAGNPIPCVAGPGISCFCPRCTATDFSPFENNTHRPNIPANFNRNYHFGPESSGGQSLSPSTTSSLDYRQPGGQYDWAHQNSLSFVPSSYVSMPTSISTSARSLNPSSYWVPESSYSTSFSIGGQVPQRPQLEMGGALYNSYSKTTPNHQLNPNNPKKNLPRRRPTPRKQGIIALPNTENSNELDYATFLEAQKYLRPSDGNTLSIAQKGHLSDFLGISQSQLDLCIKVRHEIMPIFGRLSSTGSSNGLQADKVAQWFVEEQSQQSNMRRRNDSAYQYKADVSEDMPLRTKKRKMTTGHDNTLKYYQCTFIQSEDGQYCEKEFTNYSDWKRHEETHWPQKHWVCLCADRSGTGGAIVCHFCSGHIALVGQPSTTSHHTCIDRMSRKGHSFPRKDKLSKHVKEAHGCDANIDLWYKAHVSEWKQQCGFCGSTFSNWDDRCQHVGLHFNDKLDPKRMRPDWKDPWPENAVLSHNKPGDDDGDDSEEDHDDHDDDKDDTYGAPPKRKQKPRPRKAGEARKNIADGKGSSGKGPSDNGNGNTTRSDPSIGENGENSENRQHLHRSLQGQSQRQISRQSKSKIQNPRDDTRKGGGVFTWKKDLGHGAFGTVDEVEHFVTKTHFARKTVRITGGRGLPAQIQAHREVVALRNLSHPHIINIVASYTWDGNFSMIMYPVAENNLSELLLNENATSFKRVSKLQLSLWIGCLLSAVSYMHEKSWQHLDIKPSNILITGNRVMLSDFGGALNTDELHSRNNMDRSCTITPMYCAPEISSHTKARSLSTASDIWSLGCVFLEMVTVIYRVSVRRFDDYRSFGSGDGTYHKNSQRISFWIDHLQDINESLGLPPSKGLRIISRMLSRNWETRPSAHDILKSSLMYSPIEKMGFREERCLPFVAAQHMYAFAIAVRSWLRSCWLTHKNCSTFSQTQFSPSRLLNVGKDSNFIHLQSTAPSSSEPYVTLSHCWGNGEVLKTTLDTLERMSQGIAISSLSNTFLHAVRITRALGFYYLWIDALCIVQDSTEDWTVESSQMDKIYSHSSLTISILGDYEQPFTSSQHKPLNKIIDVKKSTILCPSCPGNSSGAFEPLVTNTTTTMLLDSALSKRAWTFQEAILSPRILYFSATEIAWECLTDCPSLDSISIIRRTIQSLALSYQNSLCNLSLSEHTINTTIPPLLSPTPPPASHDYRKIWHEIVREYSKRELTYPEDKLPALAGIVSIIAQASSKSYVAGLWKEDLIHHPSELLWCRGFASIPLPKLAYRAPSWSWASIEGATLWPKHIFADLDELANPDDIQIIDCYARPISEISPYGGVSDAYLRIRGPQMEFTVTRPNYEQLVFIDTGSPFAFVQWDALHTVQEIFGSPVGERGYTGRLEFTCLRLLPTAGLVLTRKKENGLGTSRVSDRFERVGIYWHDGESSLFPTRKQDSRDWKYETITIV